MATETDNSGQSVNLIYIRAAIEHNTGIRLSLSKIRDLLLEEGLIDQNRAYKHAQIFTGYEEFFDAPTLPVIDSEEQEIEFNEDC